MQCIQWQIQVYAGLDRIGGHDFIKPVSANCQDAALVARVESCP